MPYSRYLGDTYLTPPGSSTFWGRAFPSLSLTLKVLGIIRREGLLAAKGSYSGADWTHASQSVLQALEESGCRAEVTGMNGIAHTEGACVFIGNHMSTLETFVLPLFIQPRKDVTFVVKESLLRQPYFQHVLKSRDPIAVGRTNPREDFAAVLEGGVERLKAGRSIIIFPQSTRNRELIAGQFNSIGVKLARKADVPIIPIALDTEAWGNGKGLLKDFGRIRPEIPIRILFGNPLGVEGNGKAEHAEIYRFIEENLARWRAMDGRES